MAQVISMSDEGVFQQFRLCGVPCECGFAWARRCCGGSTGSEGIAPLVLDRPRRHRPSSVITSVSTAPLTMGLGNRFAAHHEWLGPCQLMFRERTIRTIRDDDIGALLEGSSGTRRESLMQIRASVYQALIGRAKKWTVSRIVMVARTSEIPDTCWKMSRGERESRAGNLQPSTARMRPERCPPQRGPLCEGAIRNRLTANARASPSSPWIGLTLIVVCPWHGWEFDLTTGSPYFDAHRMRVRTYEGAVERQEYGRGRRWRSRSRRR